MADLGWEKKGQCAYEGVSKVWMCSCARVCERERERARAGPGREERGQCDLLGSFSSDSGPHTSTLKGGTLRKKTKPLDTVLLAKRSNQN